MSRFPLILCSVSILVMQEKIANGQLQTDRLPCPYLSWCVFFQTIMYRRQNNNDKDNFDLLKYNCGVGRILSCTPPPIDELNCWRNTEYGDGHFDTVATYETLNSHCKDTFLGWFRQHYQCTKTINFCPQLGACMYWCVSQKTSASEEECRTNCGASNCQQPSGFEPTGEKCMYQCGKDMFKNMPDEREFGRPLECLMYCRIAISFTYLVAINDCGGRLP